MCAGEFLLFYWNMRAPYGGIRVGGAGTVFWARTTGNPEVWMRSAIWRRRGALLCALSLLLCLPLVRPWLAMGTIDDTSYTRSAQVLAQTGHIVYNGWQTAMLGWHLYWGALFIRLFGFSFNVTRLSTLPVAMATAFLAQRSQVRAGLTERNATLATLTLVLSPLFLPLTFSYMTDIGGLLVLVLCFYGCVRALTATSDQSACLWLAFSAVTNGAGGSIRQIAWLGLLAMLPATIWLLRRRRTVLLWGCVSLVCGLAIMLGSLEWYRHQPYTTPEQLWHGRPTRNEVRSTVQSMARLLFDAPLFLLPVLLPFLRRVQWTNWRRAFAFLGVALGLCAVLLVVQRQPLVWLEPSMGDYVSQFGVLSGTDIHGTGPVILGTGIRVVLTVLVLAAVSAFVVVLSSTRAAAHRQAADVLSWPSLLLLTLPFSAVYLALLTSRASVNMVFDRYLVPLLFVAALLVVRWYQERMEPQFPSYSFALVAIVAVYSVGATHDAFARLRARVAAARAIEARGVPDNEIDGGPEFNTWTVLERSGVLSPVESLRDATGQDAELACAPAFQSNIPGLHPRYTLSYDSNGCGGQVSIPPVAYQEWFGPHEVPIYIVSSRRPVR